MLSSVSTDTAKPRNASGRVSKGTGVTWASFGKRKGGAADSMRTKAVTTPPSAHHEATFDAV
jgi:hypothetical protein